MAPGDKNLDEAGHGRSGAVADAAPVNGDFPPAQDPLAFLGYDPLKYIHLGSAEIIIAVGEDHPHPVAARTGQGESQHLAFPAEEAVRYLDQDAGPVTGVLVSSTGTTVTQVFQNGQGVIYDIVRFVSLDINHEPHTASIMLEGRIVQALPGW